MPEILQNKENEDEAKIGANKTQNQQNQDNTKSGPKQEQTIKEKLFGVKKTNAEEKDELTQTLQRLQAEFENYQKRSVKQNEEYKNYANAKLMEEILPVLDSLEKGIEHNKDLAIIHEQLYSTLKKNGLTKINAEKGKAFDHEKMECLMQEKNPALGDHIVANVLIGGYMLNGKILRLAKVSVNVLEKEKQNEKNGDKEEVTKINYEVKKMEE